jgi:hypothetical protein
MTDTASRRRSAVSHLTNIQPAPAAVAPTPPLPSAPLDARVWPIGTHHVSDETGEYLVDPATGKVLRKL